MNVARLRADTDAGKTGDKTPGIDPAAAPLGTDDEAAGTPVPPALAEDVRRYETRLAGARRGSPNAAASADVAGATDTNMRPAGTLGARWFVAGIALALAVGVVSVWLAGAWP